MEHNRPGDPVHPALIGDPWADRERIGAPFSKDPSVVRLGDRYLLYVSLPPDQSCPQPQGNQPGEAGWTSAVAVSDDLISWQLVADIGPFGDYDANGTAAPGAVVIDGQVHLFFQTYGNGRDDAICHAVSDDGISFTANPANPVFAPTGDWTCGRAIDADVVRAGDRLLLAWATRDPQMEVQMVGTAWAPIDSSFGPDSWTQLSVDGPALRPELDWERDCIEAPALHWDGERFTMFYAGGYNNEPQQIGWATSTDGIDWVRGTEQPFIANGAPGSWNSSESGHPGLFTDHDGSSFLFFQGNADHGRTWEIAATRIGWTAAGPELLG
ncbi:family 43 glycosylhydrolase [Microlunatus soli]|uniref:Glycosyl hydrolases family 43 n=1 Tax=Microlunatus soli TaxID=630515 RepID=A0A1H1RFZ0_9ACTN|nr:Glycosyl hydrolases family 43 [Microlunatus soli]